MNNQSQYFTTLSETENWLIKIGIKDYIIHDDLTVDVKTHVDLAHKNLQYLPVKFGMVNGHFKCSFNPLKSRKGAPYFVNGSFEAGGDKNYPNYQKLTSLAYSPKEVRGSFSVRFANLTNLIGMPATVGREVVINHCQLKSLEGMIKKVKANFYCESNELTTLEYGPEIIEGNFNCSFNHLKDLIFSPQHVHNHYGCANNQLTSLKGLPTKLKSFNCCYNPLENLNDLEDVSIEGYIYIPNLGIVEGITEEYVNTLTLKGKNLKMYIEKLKLEQSLKTQNTTINKPFKL